MAKINAILLTVRFPGLFSVWSNTLAAWWLGGGGPSGALLLVAGITGLVWIGMALLNDVIDAEFDQEHHPARSIPSGHLHKSTAWFWSLATLSGSLLLSFAGAGLVAGILCTALVVTGVVTTAIHRFFPLWPLLAGSCRVLVYLIAGTMANQGVTGFLIWAALAMAAFTSGLGFCQATLPTHAPLRLGVTGLLAVPIGLALVVNAGPFLQAALLLGAVFGFWVAFALYQGWQRTRNTPLLASAWLVPGIILADWLALGNPPGEVSLVMLTLFTAAVFAELLTPRTGSEFQPRSTA